jgi:predicted membrane-bound spermidine synthase
MSRRTLTVISYATIAFIAGGAVLVVEITGARLMAGTLGNSIYTWSALIAAILISLSFGSIIGGLLVDRYLHLKCLLWTMAFAAVTTALVPVVSSALQDQVAKMGLIEGALIACVTIFALPSFAYGMVPPICVKLLTASTDAKTVGRHAGVVSMSGSLGSFFGALITPFWLLPNFTLTAIFLGIAAIVMFTPIVLVVVARPLKSARLLILLGLGGALLFAALREKENVVEPPVIFERQTAYHRIRVEERPIDGTPARFLYLDTTLEGGIVPGSDILPLEYQNTWRLVPKLGLRVERVLCIGAGAFGIPIQLSQAYPEARIDVAEIDPQVIHAGFEFFGLGQYPNVRAVAADGRLFLRDATERYDVIFVDAYHGIRYIPPHLATVEFFQLCHDRLAPNGIVMMNIISAGFGPNAELFRAFGATVRSVFPSVQFIALQPAQLQTLQNIVLVCSSSFLPPEIDAGMAGLADYIPPDEKPMVDQKNPIEAILARQLRRKE